MSRIRFIYSAEPNAPPSDHLVLFADTLDNRLKTKDQNGTIRVLDSLATSMFEQYTSDAAFEAIYAPLINGHCYFNTTTQTVRVYTDTGWEDLSETLALTASTTGLKSGGVITPTGPNSISISEIRGQVVDYSDPSNILRYDVTYPANPSYTITTVTGNALLGIDRFGVLHELLDELSTEYRRDYILFGGVSMVGGAIVEYTDIPTNLSYGGQDPFNDFLQAVLKAVSVEDNIISPNAGGNLSIDSSGGSIFQRAINFRNDPKKPSEVDIPPASPIVLLFRMKRFGGQFIVAAGPVSTLDPAQYDPDGNGVLQPVPDFQYSVQVVYATPKAGFYIVAYGQQLFTTLLEAENYVSTGRIEFEELLPIKNWTRLCIIIVRGNAADLTNPSQASFIQDYRFRVTNSLAVPALQKGFEYIEEMIMPGLVQSKLHIEKSGTNTINIYAGSGYIRKSDGIKYYVSWEDTLNYDVAFIGNQIPWVCYKWNPAEDDIVLDIIQFPPDEDILEFEQLLVLGRIWYFEGELVASGRHACFSYDPAVSRDICFSAKSYNISVAVDASAVDVNYLQIISGTMFRWPVMEPGLKHHIFDTSGLTQLLTIWGHLVGQAYHDDITDTGLLGYDNITEIADWYDSSGTPALVPITNFSIHALAIYPQSEVRVWFRGQELFPNIDAAKAGLSTVTFDKSEWAESMQQLPFVSYVILRRGCRDFTDPAQAYFQQVSGTGGGGGGAASSSSPWDVVAGGIAYDSGTVFVRNATTDAALEVQGHAQADLKVQVRSEPTAGRIAFDGSAGDFYIDRDHSLTNALTIDGTTGDVVVDGRITSGTTITIDGTVTPGTITDSSGEISFDNEDLTTTGTVSATTFSGDLLGTINTATTGTTQPPLDNSTKIATTEYVDSAVFVENLWERTGTTLSPYTAGDDVETSGHMLASNTNGVTGVDSGFNISSPSFTLLNITAGTGSVYNYDTPLAPTLVDVSYPGATNYAVLNIGTDGSYALLIDSSATLSEKRVSELTISDFHDYLVIGGYYVRDGIISKLFRVPGNVGYHNLSVATDFIRDIIGPANINGNIISAWSGGGRYLDNSGGSIFVQGAGIYDDSDIPYERVIPAYSQFPMARVIRDATDGIVMVHSTSNVAQARLNQWDDGSGTAATVTPTYATVQIIYISPDGNYYQALGQKEFSTVNKAVNALYKGTLEFEERPPLTLFVRRAYLICRENTTNIYVEVITGTARIIPASRYRQDAIALDTDVPEVNAPGGVDGQITFNKEGSLWGGVPNLIWNESRNLLEITDGRIWIQNTGPGETVISQDSLGILLTANEMGLVDRHTPGLKFGSTDSAFTTYNPKWMAGIFGLAAETYLSDTDSGMSLHFYTTPNNAGANPVPTDRGSFTATGAFHVNKGVSFNLENGQNDIIFKAADGTDAYRHVAISYRHDFGGGAIFNAHNTDSDVLILKQSSGTAFFYDASVDDFNFYSDVIFNTLTDDIDFTINGLSGPAYSFDASADSHTWTGSSFSFADPATHATLSMSSPSYSSTILIKRNDTNGALRFGNITGTGNVQLYADSTRIANLSNISTIFNNDNIDHDFIINKNTSGIAYNYNAGTDRHYFSGNVGFGIETASENPIQIKSDTPITDVNARTQYLIQLEQSPSATGYKHGICFTSAGITSSAIISQDRGSDNRSAIQIYTDSAAGVELVARFDWDNDTYLYGGLNVSKDAIFNIDAGDNDFVINRQTSGVAYQYDASTLLHTFNDSVDIVGDVEITGDFGVLIGTNNYLTVAPGIVRINSSLQDVDFVVDSDIATNAFKVDAQDGYVGVNVATPGERLDVDGNIKCQQQLFTNYFVQSSGTSLTMDMNNGNVQKILMSADDITVNNPTNLRAGAIYVFQFKQDSVTGERDVASWGTAWKFKDDIDPNLSNGTDDVDCFTFICDGFNLWECGRSTNMN